MKDLWIRIRFRFKDWKWGTGPSDHRPWYTKLYRLWELGENKQFSERNAKHYVVFGINSSRTAGVMHPFLNVVADSVRGPNRKGSAGGPSIVFRHYPYPEEAGTKPPISSGYIESVFGVIRPDGTIPNEEAWIDVLTHYRSATVGSDDGIVEHWINGIAIDKSKPGSAEISYKYGSPTDRFNLPTEGSFDHVVLLDNTGALHPGTAANAQLEVDRFSIFPVDPRR